MEATAARPFAELLEEITQRLVKALQPERIILFGSYAWGAPSADSDLDLLVIVPQSDESPTRRAARAYQHVLDVPMPLDILVKTRAEVNRFRHVHASMVCEILERGRVLYG